MRSTLKNLAYNAGDRFGNAWLMPPRTAFGFYTNNGPRGAKRVALTFDDGPCRDSTEHLLDAMAELDVRGTFFCVGENAAMNPDILRRIDAEGHVVGNHSQAHRRGSGLSLRDTAHIDDAARQIGAILGKFPRLYRPPWGWLVPWEGRRLRARGYTIVGWDVYTLDWQIPEPDSDDVARGIIRDVQPGSVICLHDAFPLKESWTKAVTVDVVRAVVPELRAKGYEFVTMDTMLGTPAYGPALASAIR